MRQFYVVIAGLFAASSAVAQSVPVLSPDQCRLEAFYRLTYQPDSTDKTTRTELLRLQVGSQLSRFESRNAIMRDSALNAAVATAMTQSGASGEKVINLGAMPGNLAKANFKELIFKVSAVLATIVYDRMGTTRYVYQEPPGAYTWAIGPATATIAGYACQRATTTFGGRQWEAWFTREVPVAEGPYKFAGLPGLIVKVGDVRSQYVFELVKLTKPATSVPIALPEAGAKAVDKATFRKGKAAYDRTALDQLMASGNIRFNSPEDAEAAKQKARDRAKKNNNPLELK